MAPTEILATQHYLYMKRLLLPLTYTVDLLVSARKSNEKAELKRRVAEGSVNVVVGTHTLVEGDVEFARLGLAIVDEQHRFGVIQRYKLTKKGPNPDVLVMTATPIPRTLALTLYADLDFSVIDELPPNRTPIRTELVAESQRSRAFELIRSKVKAGEQAYVVYPLVEDPTSWNCARRLTCTSTFRVMFSPSSSSVCCTVACRVRKKSRRCRPSRRVRCRYWWRPR